jgi:LuxR family quorum-sensing transcriptional regulator LasR
MSGIPLQWVATYATKGYVKIDPIIKHCRESEEALYWDAVDGWDSATDNVRDFMRNLLASGFGSGLAIPLRSSSGKHGVLSIVSSQPLNETRGSYLQNLASARAIGMAVHSALERIRT